MIDTKRVRLSGTAIPMIGNDIDTDRIVPARFLKELTFKKMGDYFFYDSRFDTHGNPLPHILNDPRYQGASLLIVGKNFGCGSSREHAPQAMMRYGIQAVIGISFADIFAGNCQAIGIPAVVASSEDIAGLIEAISEHPSSVWQLDLATKTVVGEKRSIAIDVPESRRQALITGTWDSTALLQANRGLIQDVANRLPYCQDFF